MDPAVRVLAGLHCTVFENFDLGEPTENFVETLMVNTDQKLLVQKTLMEKHNYPFCVSRLRKSERKRRQYERILKHWGTAFTG